MPHQLPRCFLEREVGAAEHNLVPRAFSEEKALGTRLRLLPSIRHFENRRGEGPGDEVASSPVDPPF